MIPLLISVIVVQVANNSNQKHERSPISGILDKQFFLIIRHVSYNHIGIPLPLLYHRLSIKVQSIICFTWHDLVPVPSLKGYTANICKFNIFCIFTFPGMNYYHYRLCKFIVNLTVICLVLILQLPRQKYN